MKKKLFKYIKFLVSMALILSLVAPSYASLSASDGSAFVTKAEFDSALADFNARLTTFEAGINSKIDSQVTSYLDRNGIWSGQDNLTNSVLPLIYNGEKFLWADGSAIYKSDGVTSISTLAAWKVNSTNSEWMEFDVTYKPDYTPWRAIIGKRRANSTNPISTQHSPIFTIWPLLTPNKSGLLFYNFDVTMGRYYNTGSGFTNVNWTQPSNDAVDNYDWNTQTVSAPSTSNAFWTDTAGAEWIFTGMFNIISSKYALFQPLKSEFEIDTANMTHTPIPSDLWTGDYDATINFKYNNVAARNIAFREIATGTQTPANCNGNCFVEKGRPVYFAGFVRYSYRLFGVYKFRTAGAADTTAAYKDSSVIHGLLFPYATTGYIDGVPAFNIY